MNGGFVCVFAKPPVPGYVKTRLAAVIGPDAAAALASAMLCDVWSAVCSTQGATPVLAAACPGRFPIQADHLWLQEGDTLDQRIESILAKALQFSPAAMALGADTPGLTPEYLLEAFARLAEHDAVLGPCDDGGFYLLGIKSCQPGLLRGIEWSCADTCAQTARRLSDHGMSVSTLRPLADVDVVADLANLEAAGPATRAWRVANTW